VNVGGRIIRRAAARPRGRVLAWRSTTSPGSWPARGGSRSAFRDFVLANVALYWLTGTAGSSIRSYYENARAKRPTEPTTIPIALAAAAAGDFKSIRRFADRDHANIVSWHVLSEVTGHYAAHTNPAALAADIRGFFSRLS
jgi:epoxide hydrolase